MSINFIRPFLNFTDILLKPRKVNYFKYHPINIIYCKMSPLQRIAYDKLKHLIHNNLIEVINNKGIENCQVEILNGINALRLACFSTNILINNKININESIKNENLFNMLCKLSKSNVVVVSGFKNVRDQIAVTCSKNNLPYFEFNGYTKNRVEVITNFNSEESNINILLASSQSISVGVNLRADYFFLIDTNPSGYTNSLITLIARAYHYKKTLKVYTIVCKDTIDEKLIKFDRKFIKSQNKSNYITNIKDFNELFG